MSYTVTEEMFLAEVSNHHMHIIRDDGVYRHIRFKEDGTNNMMFELITWPGYLCYTGDVGTFVFTRVEDMFRFFRHDSINPGYWAQKLESVDRADGFKVYSEEKFECIVNETVDEYIEEEGLSDDVAEELREEVRSDVISQGEFEVEAHHAAADFKFGDFKFTDFWEHDLCVFSGRFIWCCYALVWGIKQYDKSTEAVAA